MRPRAFPALGCALICCAALAFVLVRGAARDHVNFIVILADDLGPEEISSYGGPEGRTPHIDRLADRGFRFDNCYATPICYPTRFEILTGQYGFRNGARHLPGYRAGPEVNDLMEGFGSHLTFAGMLREKGYATALAGKWQLPGTLPELIHEAGFDEYLAWAQGYMLPPGTAHTGGVEGKGKNGVLSRYWHPSLLRNGAFLETDPGDYGPDMFADFVVEFAERNRDRPFLVYYPMVLPHVPYFPTPEMKHSEEKKFKRNRKNYDRYIRYMDRLVGRIAEALERTGLDRNTYLLFTGDNGSYRPDSGPEWSGKGEPGEEGARVPMIVKGPGIEGGLLKTELIDFSDIFPTLLELAGAGMPKGHVIDGRSFAPLLLDGDYEPREWIFSYIADRRILRTSRWLLEDNSPLHYGRLLDCDGGRHGKECTDVTETAGPEVVEAKRRFGEILPGLPAPLLDEDGPVMQKAAPPR